MPYTPTLLDQASGPVLALYEVAAVTARAAARQGRKVIPRKRRGLTLTPGPRTPIWNELVEQAIPLLAKRGSKAQLARILGVPRQRLQDCLKARSACLDAERTLLLLCWVVARQQGRELTA